MADPKILTQFDLRFPPTAETNIVRLKDMIEYVGAMTAAPSRVVMTDPFTATYDPTGMTLTQTTPEELEIDGVIVAQDDRILVAGQLDATQNGVYAVTTLGVTSGAAAVLTRTDDFDESAQFKQGMIFPVTDGDENANTRWKMTLGAIPFVLDGSTVSFEKDVVDFTRVVEMTFAIEGDDTTAEYNFSHNWDTMNVTHEIFEDATGDTVMAGFRRINANTVQVRFGGPLGVGEDYTLVIRAEVEPV